MPHLLVMLPQVPKFRIRLPRRTMGPNRLILIILLSLSEQKRFLKIHAKPLAGVLEMHPRAEAIRCNVIETSGGALTVAEVCEEVVGEMGLVAEWTWTAPEILGLVPEMVPHAFQLLELPDRELAEKWPLCYNAFVLLPLA